MDMQQRTRNELRRFIQINNIKYDDISKKVNLSKSMISMFINGHRNLSEINLRLLEQQLKIVIGAKVE